MAASDSDKTRMQTPSPRLLAPVAALVALSGVHCWYGLADVRPTSTGSGGGSSTTSGSGKSSSSSASSSTTSSSGGTGGEPADAGSDASDGGVGPGFCASVCDAAVDCCFGASGCPGPSYPYNYTCEDGACHPPECASDADCSGLKCVLYRGYHSCVSPCVNDADCGGIPNYLCTGVAPDQTKYCTSVCSMDSDCFGFGKCVSGNCQCDTNADCTLAGFDRCIHL